jgi:hypothetical protein
MDSFSIEFFDTMLQQKKAIPIMFLKIQQLQF